MKWLITGGTGQLGHELRNLLRQRSSLNTVWAPDRAEMDLTNPARIQTCLRDFQPDVVVNCAAWTDVDGAEEHEDEAFAVNAKAPEVMAETVATLGRSLLVQVSTDYVFSGSATEPYAEDAPLSPQSAYGRSKASGEEAVRVLLPDDSFVVRTAWLYSAFGRNFVRTIAEKLRQGVPLKVVTDQVGHPTWTYDVAHRVLDLVTAWRAESVPPGAYHAVNSGVSSWWGLARAVADLTGFADTSIDPVQSSEFPRPARRPSRVELEDAASRDFGIPMMRNWRLALSQALPTMPL